MPNTPDKDDKSGPVPTPVADEKTKKAAVPPPPTKPAPKS